MVQVILFCRAKHYAQNTAYLRRIAKLPWLEAENSLLVDQICGSKRLCFREKAGNCARHL